MLETPLMSKVFDLIEGMRAVPNGRTPFNDEIRVVKDIVYKTVGDKKLYMDLYLPNLSAGERVPVVLEIPGGGWMIHNRNRRDGYARLLAVMGAAVAVIDHRLCPQVFFPENLIDVVDAANYLQTLAPEYNLDLSNVTVTGDSSGGHLGACLCCAATDENYAKKLGLPSLGIIPAGFIAVSGSFSFEVMYRIPFTHLLEVRYFSGQRSRKAFRNWEFYRESIPYNFINKDFPVTYNNGGMTDFLCAGEAKRMAKVLDAAGVANEYCVGKNLFNSMHCYVLRLPFSSARKDMLKLLGWYRDRQSERGADMGEGYKRIEKFFKFYKKALKCEVKC